MTFEESGAENHAARERTDQLEVISDDAGSMIAEAAIGEDSRQRRGEGAVTSRA
jgi:hypothetical protein